MANKGLTIGVAVLVAIGGVILLTAKRPPGEAPVPAPIPAEQVQQQQTPELPVETAAETAEAETPETGASSETASETAASPGMESAPEASATEAAAEPGTVTEGSLLANPPGLDIDVPKAMEERVLGNPDAPVTIIEYASMTCPHCAHFHREYFADVKARLIDTGKARFIFREFPLDDTAMRASMMARCADHDKFFDLVEVIFRNQDRWIKSDDPKQALQQYGALAGMDENYIKLCMGNAELENAMLRSINEGQKRYSIQQTPTFIFNSGADRLSGAQPVEKFEEIVQKLSLGK